MDSTTEGIERLRPPGLPAFLPWLFMLSGDVQGLFTGEFQLPWLGGAGMAAYAALYTLVCLRGLDGDRRSTPGTYAALGGLVATTLALTIGYAGDWMRCFPVTALAVGVVLRGPRLGQGVLSLAVVSGVINGFHDGFTESALTVSYETMISGLVTAAILSLFDAIRMLRATRQELARTAVEKERLRFSRDLHDLLGHTLSVVVVKAEAVRRLAPRDLDAALGQAADIEAVGRQALTEIREAVTGYREGSLATELERAASLLDASAIETTVRRSEPPLSPQAEALLGWVVREGVTNVVRHSRAAHCRVEVHGDEDRVRLEIHDDGRGPGPGPGGTGLKGLTERLAAAGGSLECGAAAGGGFRLVAALPMGWTEGPAPDGGSASRAPAGLKRGSVPWADLRRNRES